MRWWEMIVQRFRVPVLMERMFDRFEVRAPLAERPGGAETLQRAAARCRGCPDNEACLLWLEQTEEPEAPPPFCRNAGLIARLQRGNSTLH